MWNIIMLAKYSSAGADPEILAEGGGGGWGESKHLYFFCFSHHNLQRGDGVHTNILSSLLSARQRNAISMAFSLCSDDGIQWWCDFPGKGSVRTTDFLKGQAIIQLQYSLD